METDRTKKNPIAKILSNPLFKPKTVPDKKKIDNKTKCRRKIDE